MAFILEVVDRQGTATYEALAEWMQVSTMTVRRDCEDLIRLGKIIKTIGGSAGACPRLPLRRSGSGTNCHQSGGEAIDPRKGSRAYSKSADDFYRWRDHQSGAGQIAGQPAHRTYHPH